MKKIIQLPNDKFNKLSNGNIDYEREQYTMLCEHAKKYNISCAKIHIMGDLYNCQFMLVDIDDDNFMGYEDKTEYIKNWTRE